MKMRMPKVTLESNDQENQKAKELLMKHLSETRDQNLLNVKEMFYESSMRIPLEWIDSDARYSGVGVTFSARIVVDNSDDTEALKEKLTEFVHATLEAKLKEQIDKALGIMKSK